MGYKDFTVKMTKEEIIKLVKESKQIIAYKEKFWFYPNSQSNNGNNAFMQMSFEVEKKSGTMVWIPDNPDEPVKRIPPITRKDVWGNK